MLESSCFRTLLFREMWLLECLTVPVFRHSYRGKVVTGLKHCWSHHGSNFIINFHYSQTHWVGRLLCYSDLKFCDCLVTQWLPMTCILVIIWKNFPESVQAPISQKRERFSEFSFTFLQSTQNFSNFEKKHQVHSLNILEVIDSEKSGSLNTREFLF